jgi:hypothetical protein
MPVDAIGSAEVLLKLLAIYQGGNGKRPDLKQIWRQISTHGQSEATLYGVSGEEPAPQFLRDLDQLHKWGLVRPLGDGRLEVTPLGHIASHGRKVPSTFASLRESIEKLP